MLHCCNMKACMTEREFSYPKGAQKRNGVLYEDEILDIFSSLLIKKTKSLGLSLNKKMNSGRLQAL